MTHVMAFVRKRMKPFISIAIPKKKVLFSVLSSFYYFLKFHKVKFGNSLKFQFSRLKPRTEMLHVIVDLSQSIR